MSLKLSFSWIGLVIFALPMLINIAFVAFPPAERFFKELNSPGTPPRA